MTTWIALLMCMTFATLAAPPAAAQAQPAADPTLDLYFIDVEGGQATLIVLPDRRTLLVDAGYAGTGGTTRDTDRILEVAKQAGVSRIDFLVVTHYHGDHAGGVPDLQRRLPIDTFIDHGDLSEAAARDSRTLAVFQAYGGARASGRRLQPKPGERLPITGVTATVLSSAGATLSSSLPAATAGPNAACATPALPAAESNENPQSLSFMLEFGRFRFFDPGDLTGAPLHALVCPSDRLGPVDLYLVAHHGGDDAAHPAIYAALQPRVAIVNNGPIKGGGEHTLRALRGRSGTDTWQLHQAVNAGDANSAQERIANVSETTAHHLLVRARRDGSFTVSNSRTGASTEYPPRR